MAILENIDIDIEIDNGILQNIDIDNGILQNIDFDEISYRLGFEPPILKPKRLNLKPKCLTDSVIMTPQKVYFHPPKVVFLQ